MIKWLWLWEKLALEGSKVWKIISFFVFLPLGSVLVIFAVVNRYTVILSFWPFPVTLEVPLSLVIMLALIIGVLWGGIVSWCTASHVRHREREAAKRADKAEVEVGNLKDKIRLLEVDDKVANKIVTNRNEQTKSASLPEAKIT